MSEWSSPVANLDLRFTQDNQETRLFIPTQDAPWRAIRAFRNQYGQAVVHLHNVSGGILSGDSLHLSIDAGAATRVQITSVGATRIYRQRPGRAPASLSTSIRVEDGATLEYLPDLAIPFAGSSFTQMLDVSLGVNAGFIGWETIAAGRVAGGEEFAFDSFNSEASVCSDIRPLAKERWSLVPAARDPRSTARWGPFRYVATLYVCHTGVAQPQWLALEARLNEFAFEQTSYASRWGVSTLVANGIVVRGLALEAHFISTALHTFWDLSKQQIWGEPAIPPRKIN